MLNREEQEKVEGPRLGQWEGGLPQQASKQRATVNSLKVRGKGYSWGKVRFRVLASYGIGVNWAGRRMAVPHP